MVLQVRLFAVLRERAGRDSLEVEVAEGATVAEALQALGAANEPLGAALEAMPVVMAVNRSYVDTDAALSPGDELALIRPVSGGPRAAALPPVRRRGRGAPAPPRPRPRRAALRRPAERARRHRSHRRHRHLP